MMVILRNEVLSPGVVIMKRLGEVVFIGKLDGSEWPAIEADTFILSGKDYDAVSLRTLPDGRKIP